MYNFEQIGLIPRSIIRTLRRFFKQISLKTDLFVIYEFRVSRYIAIASLQCFFFLIICPWIFQFFVKFLFLNTFLKYKTISTDIFMNFHQQERAFSQIQTFSQKIYFETLLESFEMIQKNQRNIPTFGRGKSPQGSIYKFVDSSREVISSWPLPRGELLTFVGPDPADGLKTSARAHHPIEKFIEPKFNAHRPPNCLACLINQKKLLGPRPLKPSASATGPSATGPSAPGPSATGPSANGSAQGLPPHLTPGPRITKTVKNYRPKRATSPCMATRSDTGDNYLPKSRRFGRSTQSKKGESLDQELSLSDYPSEDRDVLQVSLGSTAQIYQSYFLKCANFYNKQSATIITNWILDLVTLLFFLVLLILSTPQILILKTFCIESLLSLSETTKCFFLIFFLDLLVGFHSSKSWEIFLQFFIEHFGLQIHQNFIAFFISTFPVLLDTIFKYWIFRYLNKISPSTVATYQAMIE